jgi:hypothetical protein
MTRLKLYQRRSLKHAYGFARSGNSLWARLWMDQAHSYCGVARQQVQYANRLLVKACGPYTIPPERYA